MNHVGADVLICPVEQSSTYSRLCTNRSSFAPTGQMRTSAPTRFVAIPLRGSWRFERPSRGRICPLLANCEWHLLWGPRLIELAPSILAADFAHLADQVRDAAAGGGTVVHVDIMDGHFVPNLTMGPPLVKSLRKATDLPLDCHLMIENPDQFIPEFCEAGANWISVHQEACVAPEPHPASH